MKKLVALLLTLTFVLSMCCAFAEYEQIDYNNTTLFGDVGPDGSVPGGLEDVMLTEEEKEQVRAGGYTVAICYHQLDNQVNQSKLAACQAVLEDLNIEVLCVTDAQSDATKEVNDLETALAMNPDILISMHPEGRADGRGLAAARCDFGLGMATFGLLYGVHHHAAGDGGWRDPGRRAANGCERPGRCGNCAGAGAVAAASVEPEPQGAHILRSDSDGRAACGAAVPVRDLWTFLKMERD